MNLAAGVALELVTSAADAVDWTISYSTRSSALKSASGTVSSATTTTLLAAPTTPNWAVILDISIRNRGAGSNTVTIQKDDAGSNYIVHRAVLGAGEAIVFTASGWRHTDVGGTARVVS